MLSGIESPVIGIHFNIIVIPERNIVIEEFIIIAVVEIGGNGQQVMRAVIMLVEFHRIIAVLGDVFKPGFYRVTPFAGKQEH